MCLAYDENDAQSRTRYRRRLALMVILWVTFFLLIGLRHPQPGPDADFFDFLRGLTIGVALTMTIFMLRLCARRPGKNQ